jgi:Ser/Thr protein kinase RdoA (MazF antagonist)
MDRSATAPQPAETRALPLRPSVGAPFPADESLSGRTGVALDRIAPALAAIADAPAAAPVWCHGDLFGDDVVITGPRAVRHLVDFTGAASGPCESDVAQTLAMTGALASARARTVTDAYPLALDDHQLAAWTVFPTMCCWAHSEPGDDHTRWARRLDELSRRTPHLLRVPRHRLLAKGAMFHEPERCRRPTGRWCVGAHRPCVQRGLPHV